MSAADERPRELPAGDPRSLPTLDRLAEELNKTGENVQVVYSYHGDKYRIVEKRPTDEVQYRSDLGQVA